MFIGDLSSIIVAASAALVGIVALGSIIGVVMRAVNKRQSEHITAVVATAIDAKLKPIKEAVGEKNGNGDAMEMLAKTLGQTAELLAGQDDITELEHKLIELHGYTHQGVHRLNGQVGMMWLDWAKQHGVDPDDLPAPQPSPKEHQ